MRSRAISFSHARRAPAQSAYVRVGHDAGLFPRRTTVRELRMSLLGAHEFCSRAGSIPIWRLHDSGDVDVKWRRRQMASPESDK
jgi:hypothetical protein